MMLAALVLRRKAILIFDIVNATGVYKIFLNDLETQTKHSRKTLCSLLLFEIWKLKMSGNRIQSSSIDNPIHMTCK